MLLLVALLTFIWCVQLLLALRIVFKIPTITGLKAEPLEKWPKLSILVPARDEGAGIEGALKSKLSTHYPDIELVAVDDRSSDETGAIIDRIAAADPRVRAVHVDVLPEGWLGKLNAMNVGMQGASGEWILFSDADVHVEPGVLEKIIATAEREKLDFVAVFPRMRSVNPVIDAATAVTLRVLLLAARAWSSNDERSHLAAGVGAFNLVRRSTLERTRALEELKMEVVDDVGLALLLKHHGARCRLYAGRSAVHLVFLDSLRAAARSADKGGGMLGYSILRSFAVGMFPPAMDLVLPIAAIIYGGDAAIFGISALILATLTHLVLAIFLAAPIQGALLWPLGQVLTSVLTIRSGLLARKNQGIYWRDTFYTRKALEDGRRIRLPSLRLITSPSSSHRAL